MIESKMTGAQIQVADCILSTVCQNEDGSPALDDEGNFVTEQVPGKRITAMDSHSGTVWTLEFTMDSAEAVAAELRDKPKVDVYQGLTGHLGPGGQPRIKI